MRRVHGRRGGWGRFLIVASFAVLLATLPAAPVGAAPPIAFAAPTTLMAGERPYKVIVADMNGDGFLDIVATNKGTGATGRRVSVFLATVSMGAVTGYTKTDYLTNAAKNAPSGLAVGDLNGDGKPDFVTTTSGGSCSTQAGGGMPYYCDGVFSIFLATADSMGDVTGYSRTDYPATGGVALPFTLNDVTIADLNGDGRQDIVLTASVPFGSAAGMVRVYRASPTYTFTTFSDYAATPNAAYPMIRDFNGDGKPDIAVVGDAVSVLTATTDTMTGNVTGYSRADLNAGSNPYGLAAGDFTGDGVPDLVTANLAFSGNGTLRLFPGNGMGGFGAATTQAIVGSSTNDIATGDFNGDGALDIAVANSASSGTVNVLLNNGTGTFARSNHASGSNPYTLAVADLNKDGKLDIVVANNNTSGTVGILYGTTVTALAATAGTPQAVLMNSSYPTALRATVRDASNRTLASTD